MITKPKDQASGLREMMKRRKKSDLKKKALHIRELIAGNSDCREEKLRHVIAVTSGKGGVGKSTISANLSLFFASRGMETILLDADLGLANLDVILGIRTGATLYDVLHGIRDLPEIIQSGPLGLKFISGASGMADLANLSGPERETLIAQIARLRFEGELLLIDTGAGLSDNVIEFLMLAGMVVVVITEEPASIADSYGIIKALSLRKYPGKIMLVMNRVSGEESGIALFNRLSSAAKQFLGRDLNLAGTIMESETVRKSTRSMSPFFISHPDGDATRSLREIGGNLLGLSHLTGTDETGFLSKLASFFNKVVLK